MNYEILSKFLATKILKMENGNLSILDRGMIIIPVEVLIKLHEDLEKKIGVEDATEIVYNIGKFETLTGSIRYLKRKEELRTIFQTLSKTGDPSIEMGRETLKFMGKGNIRINNVINNGQKITLSSNSPFAKEYLETRGKSNVPVCHYLRGLMCGVMESFYKNKYQSREICCQATGLSKDCIFEFTQIE